MKKTITIKKQQLCPMCGKPYVSSRKYLNGDMVFDHKVVKELGFNVVKEHCYQANNK